MNAKKKIKRAAKPSARTSTKASKARPSAPAVKPRPTPPDAPKLSPIAERFNAAHFALCELLAELDRECPEDERLEELREIFDRARPALAAPPPDGDRDEIDSAREVVIEIGRRLDRLQRLEHDAANDVHRPAPPASRTSTPPATLRGLTDELFALARRFDALAADVAPLRAQGAP